MEKTIEVKKTPSKWLLSTLLIIYYACMSGKIGSVATVKSIAVNNNNVDICT